MQPVENPTVGFIGLGDMGGAIAKCLAGAGFDLIAYDRRSELREEVQSWGAGWADGEAVVHGRDVVAVCLVNDEQVLGAVLGPGGLLSAMKPDSCLLVFSTVTPATMRQLQEEAAGHGIIVVDAPVSGGREAADRGELTVMLGGRPEDVARVMPVVEAAGKNIFHVGDEVGAGQAAKICNNLMALNNNLVLLEGLGLGSALGLSEESLLKVAAVSTGNSWYVEHWGFTDNLLMNHPMAGEEANYYLLVKDLWCAIDAAREVKHPLVLTGLAAQYGPDLLRGRLHQLQDRGTGDTR
jgi:3-hydroxyisobutyrate dehydrogenase